MPREPDTSTSDHRDELLGILAARLGARTVDELRIVDEFVARLERLVDLVGPIVIATQNGQRAIVDDAFATHVNHVICEAARQLNRRDELQEIEDQREIDAWGAYLAAESRKVEGAG